MTRARRVPDQAFLPEPRGPDLAPQTGAVLTSDRAVLLKSAATPRLRLRRFLHVRLSRDERADLRSSSPPRRHSSHLGPTDGYLAGRSVG
jgi:hypothetical protein